MKNEELINRTKSLLTEESIGRYDLFPIFKDVELFRAIVKHLSAPYIGKVDYVVSPEAIGWILGVAIAKELNVGFIPLRKGGTLPYKEDALISHSYNDPNKKDKKLEIKKDYIPAKSKVLIVDEWIETGISMRCAIALLTKLDCEIVGLATIGTDYRDETKDWIDSGFMIFVDKGL